MGVSEWEKLDKPGKYVCVCVHIPSCIHEHRELQKRSRIDPESLDLVKHKSLGGLGSSGLAFNNNILLNVKFKSNFRFP